MASSDTFTYTVYVVDTATGQTVTSWVLAVGSDCGFYAECFTGAFRADGQFFYVQEGSTLLAYDSATYSLVSTVPVPNFPYMYTNTGLTSSTDSTKLFVGAGAVIDVFDTDTLQVVNTLPYYVTAITDSANTLLVCSINQIEVINDQTLQTETTVATASGATSANLSSDGQLAAVAYGGYMETPEIQVINVSSGAVLASVSTSIVPGYVFLSPDASEVFATGPLPDTAVSTGEWIQTYSFPLTSASTAQVLSEAIPVYAGKKLLMVYNTGLLTSVDLSDGSIATVTVSGPDAILAATADKKRVYALTGAGSDIISVPSGRLIELLNAGIGGGTSPAVAALPTQLVAYTYDNYLSSTNIETKQTVGLQYPADNGPFCGLMLDGLYASPNGRVLMATDYQSCFDTEPVAVPTLHGIGVALYKTSNDSLVTQVNVTSFVDCGTFSPDGKLAYLGETGQIAVLNIDKASVTSTWQYGEVSAWKNIVASPGGGTLYGLGVTASGTASVYEISTANGSVTNQFPLPVSATSIDIAPEGDRIAIAGLAVPYTNDVGILNLKTGALTLVQTEYATGSMVVAY